MPAPVSPQIRTVDVGPRGLLDDAEDLAHRRAHEQVELGAEALAVLGQRRRARLRPHAARDGLDRVLEVLGGVGAPDEVVGAELDGLDDLRAVAVVGHHDDGPAHRDVAQAAQDLDARRCRAGGWR